MGFTLIQICHLIAATGLDDVVELLPRTFAAVLLENHLLPRSTGPMSRRDRRNASSSTLRGNLTKATPSLR